MKTWKRRWFILTDNCLYSFEYTTVSEGWVAHCPSASEGPLLVPHVRLLCALPPQDKEPRGIIPLENLSIREVEDPRKPVSRPSICRVLPTARALWWPAAQGSRGAA